MGDKSVRMSFTVPADVKARWKERARLEGISLSELIRRATDKDRLRAKDMIEQ